MDIKHDIRALIFDWGDTVMRDFPEKPGPMCSWEKVEWIPGIEKVLEAVYKDYITVIATNAGASNTQDMIVALKRVGADHYFHYFFSSKDLGYEKPDTRFFSTISKAIGIPPENCLMIGNIYEKDITGAKDCGIKTILFNEALLTGPFPKADKVINNMEELYDIIMGWQL
jgi:FMN phosphatase YigB (HAD superfamily)